MKCRKIGECFECGGETLIVVEGLHCADCYGLYLNCKEDVCPVCGSCNPSDREDKTEVYFKRVTSMNEVQEAYVDKVFTRPIGEVFQIQNEFFKVIPQVGCENCDFGENCCSIPEIKGCCGGTLRSDHTPVIFVNVEKIQK